MLVADLSDLPAHAELVEALQRQVKAGDEWRWLELSCSLAAGRGDELSDVDVGIGHDLPTGRVASQGLALVQSLGSYLDALVHAEDSWPDGVLRCAVEYESGLQLDLVLMPAGRRPGLPDGAVALVDKDGQLSEPWTPAAASASAEQAREWCMLGWWALSDSAKHVRRGSLFEASESLQRARTQVLRLFTVGREVPFPAFGLTSLLDHEPFELPEQLATTYSVPTAAAAVIDAALAMADLLSSTAAEAGRALGRDLTTPWASTARARLQTADPRT